MFSALWSRGTVFVLLLLFPLGKTYALTAGTPVKLASTEAFLVISGGNGTSNIELRFDETLQEKLFYDRANARFMLSRGLKVAENLTVTGSIIVGVNHSTATPDAGITLEILGTASGRIFHAQDQLRSSGSLVIEGRATLNGIVVLNEDSSSTSNVRMEGDTQENLFFLNASTDRIGIGTATPKTLFEVVGAMSGSSLTISQLRNCDTIDTDAAGNLACGSDSSGGGGTFGTGNVITIGDSRYVNTSGDTMTGKLLINLSSGTDALEVIGVGSGRIVRAQDTLASSGTLVTEGRATLNGIVVLNEDGLSTSNVRMEGDAQANLFFLDAANDRIGIGTSSPDVLFEVVGAMSGNSLTVSGLRNCDTIDTNAAGVLTCGTDNVGSGAFDQASTDLRYVNTSGDTMTGKLLINLSSGTDALEVIGAMSGASVTVSQLRNCDTIDTDASGAFSCGTDDSTSGPANDSWVTFGFTACGDATVYMGFHGVANCNATEASVETTLSLNSNITVTGLRCRQTTDTTCSLRATVRKNQTSPGAPDLQCTVTNAATCGDTGSTSFTNGDEIDILIEDTGATCTSAIPVDCTIFFTY